MNIIGISAYYHDSAACLLQNGKITAAAQEERFTRKKHDAGFPINAVNFCLKAGNIDISQVELIAFYDKPILKFSRILETYSAFPGKGIRSFLKAMPLWLKQKLWIPDHIKKTLGYDGKIIFPEHHQSHAASAFFPSPFERAAFLTMDGVGEWAATSYGTANGNSINILSEIHFPHSLGLFYSAFTYYLGFKVNSGEYKVMGLAPYGKPVYTKLIYDNLIDLKSDGSFALNLDYFTYPVGLTMTGTRFNKLFGAPARKPESLLTQREMDIAASLQSVTEEVMLRTAKHVKKVTGEKNLCLAGGVALNCVGNGKILREGIFEDIWIQPASGDAGGALGAAYMAYHHYLENPSFEKNGSDMQNGSLLGTYYNDNEIYDFIKQHGYKAVYHTDDDLFDTAAALLAQGKVTGWFQGKMEFGPRALGSRSIIGDPRLPDMQKKMNIKIKYRESFRPFAPAVLQEKAAEWFTPPVKSPYMLLTAEVNAEKRLPLKEADNNLFGIDKLNQTRSLIPAVTHVDYSARLQTVDSKVNPRFYKLIKAFEEQTGCPVLINTSFNVRGEPIVESPDDAYRCFMRTGMDILIMGNYIFKKDDQPSYIDNKDWKSEYELD